jgi:hypothetical protein
MWANNFSRVYYCSYRSLFYMSTLQSIKPPLYAYINARRHLSLQPYMTKECDRLLQHYIIYYIDASTCRHYNIERLIFSYLYYGLYASLLMHGYTAVHILTFLFQYIAPYIDSSILQHTRHLSAGPYRTGCTSV